MTRVLVLNGPNLGRLGSREPEVYGSASHDELVKRCSEAGASLGLDVEVRQTDDEAELVHWLHEAVDSAADVVLNPAAFTHYSYSLRDACSQLTAPLTRCTCPTRPRARSSGTPPWSWPWQRALSPASASCPSSWRCGRWPIR